MKRLFFVFLLALVIQSASFASDFSKYLGVWASNDAEAVVTDSVCIFFENTPTGLRAFLNIPTQDIYSCTTYKDSILVFLSLSLSSNERKFSIMDECNAMCPNS